MTFTEFEAEVAEGLETIASDEIKRLTRLQHTHIIKSGVQFTYTDQFENLLQLGTVNSLYLLLKYDVPRPKALLGHQHFQRLLNAIKFIRNQSEDDFTSIYFSVAGSDTSVMKRLKSEISQHTNMKLVDEGDLLIRIRRTTYGWDVLLRVTDRPLSARSWRFCDYPAALNAPTARAMAILSDVKPADNYVNIACGSGTLLIETMAQYNLPHALGIDNDTAILRCATNNIEETPFASKITLSEDDATASNLPDNSIDVINIDLPFGRYVGSHEENLELYPALFKEMARITKPNARIVLLTHEMKLLENVIADYPEFDIAHTLRITQRGLHPKIYVLRKR